MLHIRHHAQVSVPISLETLRVDGEEGVQSVSVPFSAESHQSGVVRDGGYVRGAVCKTWGKIYGGGMLEYWTILKILD